MYSYVFCAYTLYKAYEYTSIIRYLHHTAHTIHNTYWWMYHSAYTIHSTYRWMYPQPRALDNAEFLDEWTIIENYQNIDEL